MADYGIEVYDDQGRLILDVSDSLTREAGEVFTGTENGSVSVPLFATVPASRRWALITDTDGDNTNAPALACTDSGLSWNFRSQYRSGAWVIYGVY